MKKIALIAGLLLFSYTLFSQVGISTPNPAATLDIVATNPTGTNTEVDGLLMPRIDRQRALSMAATPTSTLIYVNSTATGTATGTAINITSVGFYFFDGTVWQKLTTGINRNWELTGNTATNPTTNFLGTTDAQPLIFRTNNSERARILSDGRISFNNSTPFIVDRFSVYNTAASDYAINGYSTANGVGVFGQNTGTGSGIFGVNTNNGIAVQGINTSTTGIGGAGVYGDSSNNTSAGVFGNSNVNGGIGIYGQVSGAGQSRGVSGFTSGSNRRSYAIYGFNNASTSGNAFTSTNVAAAIYGDAVSAGNYKFGIFGDGGLSPRSGGIIGNNFGSSLGALGYYNSASINYSVYGFGSAYEMGVATGKLTPNSTLSENTQIGIGIYGGVMGGWVRGLKYGFHTKGETYSLYIDGDGYANKPLTLLTDVGDEKVASYMTTSVKPEISTNGKSTLLNGKVYVKFEDTFSKSISNQEDLNINITSQGNSKGVYVTDISKEGFWIFENDNGQSNIKLFWSATSILKNTSNHIIPKELLANDFDDKMEKVMFNDNNPNENAQSLWWDGSKIRWDKPNIKKDSNTKELMESRKLPIAVNDVIEKK
jgi:hypothetical protein